MDFDAAAAARAYSDRSVDPAWAAWCRETLAPEGRDVVDIGCGGGIYSRGFAMLGARSVVGVDRSAQYIDEATRSAQGVPHLRFQHGTATDTGLPDGCADLVFERALIHHLGVPTQRGSALEALRLLRPQGLLCVQDRTFEDVQAHDAAFWIRSALMRTYPRLLDVERSRRPSGKAYEALLRAAGFATVEQRVWAETRRSYASFDELECEILSRKGKSILFELSDAELRDYCRVLREDSAAHPLVERDRWTVWLASR
jgi:SAM-dependent methyltransferase